MSCTVIYSQDSREIVGKFLCMEVTKFTVRDRMFWDILPAALRGHFRTLRPAYCDSGCY